MEVRLRAAVYRIIIEAWGAQKVMVDRELGHSKWGRFNNLRVSKVQDRYRN